MDDIDRKIADLIGDAFPVCARPYEAVGRQAGIGEKEAYERIRDLRQAGVIRRIGALFSPVKLGWQTTLVGMKVAPENLDDAGAVVSAYPYVTHNYQREHEYNLWFTLICPDRATIEQTLEEIREKAAPDDLLNLPAVKIIKLKTDFRSDAP